jgi:hypothetical protein
MLTPNVKLEKTGARALLTKAVFQYLRFVKAKYRSNCGGRLGAQMTA